MQQRWRIAGMISLGVLLSSTVAGTQEVRSTTLPIIVTIDLANAVGVLGFTALDGLNDQDEAGGNFTAGPQAFTLTAPRQTQSVACPGAISTALKGLNNHGNLAGFCGVGSGIVGFFREAQGATTLLQVPGSTLTEAVGLNDFDAVVGDYRDASGRFHGFVWHQERGFETVDVPFAGATATGVNAINRHGEMVGLWFTAAGQLQGWYAFEGLYQVISVPGSTSTLLTDINDRGQIGGVFARADGFPQSFVMEDGHFYLIEIERPGVVFTDLAGLNNTDGVVGRYVVENPEDEFNPFFNSGFLAQFQKGPALPAQATVSTMQVRASAAPQAAPGVDWCGEGVLVPAKAVGRAIVCPR